MAINRNDRDADLNKELIDLGIMDLLWYKKIALIPWKAIRILVNPLKFFKWLSTFFLDMKYGSYLGRRSSNGNFKRGWWGSLNSNYDDLAVMFSKLEIRDNDVLVDIGCGKGRVFNFLLHRGFKNKLLGVEVDPVIAEITKKRFHKNSQIEIIIGAIENEGVLPAEGTIFYLFNPFSEAIVRNFSDQLARKIENGHFKSSDRPVIIYYYCYHLNIFAANPIWNIKILDTQFNAAIISANSK